MISLPVCHCIGQKKWHNVDFHKSSLPVFIDVKNPTNSSHDFSHVSESYIFHHPNWGDIRRRWYTQESDLAGELPTNRKWVITLVSNGIRSGLIHSKKWSYNMTHLNDSWDKPPRCVRVTIFCWKTQLLSWPSFRLVSGFFFNSEPQKNQLVITKKKLFFGRVSELTSIFGAKNGTSSPGYGSVPH